jgi:transposase
MTSSIIFGYHPKARRASNFKPSGLKRLGLDEIALLKGKGNYCAGLIDLDKSELMAILEGRTQEKIKKVLMQWGLEVLEQIAIRFD